jgi:hypothetical protein
LGDSGLQWDKVLAVGERRGEDNIRFPLESDDIFPANIGSDVGEATAGIPGTLASEACGFVDR